MTMELEGNLSLERPPTRRWVPFVAVIIPVGAIVLLAVWFVRVYVAPATVAYSESTMIVAEPAEPPSSMPCARIPKRRHRRRDGRAGARPAGERTNRRRAADVRDARGCAAGVRQPQRPATPIRAARCAVRASRRP